MVAQLPPNQKTITHLKVKNIDMQVCILHFIGLENYLNTNM